MANGNMKNHVQTLDVYKRQQQAEVNFYRNTNDFASNANGISIASKGGEGLGCPPNSVMSILEAHKPVSYTHLFSTFSAAIPIRS